VIGVLLVVLVVVVAAVVRRGSRAKPTDPATTTPDGVRVRDVPGRWHGSGGRM
jgi:hypothetical protein